MTQTPALDDVVELLRRAMNERTAQVTLDRLTYAGPPDAARRRSPWRIAAGAVAACAVGALAIAAVNGAADADDSVAAATGSSLAGVAYDLPPGWSSVQVPAPAGLRRACLAAPAGPHPSDGACWGLELMVADPVKAAGGRGSVDTDELVLEECGSADHVQWRVETALIDSAPGQVNEVQCDVGAAPWTFWTLDGSNLALFITSSAWTSTAEAVLSSMRISEELRETAFAAASSSAKATAVPFASAVPAVPSTP